MSFIDTAKKLSFDQMATYNGSKTFNWKGTDYIVANNPVIKEIAMEVQPGAWNKQRALVLVVKLDKFTDETTIPVSGEFIIYDSQTYEILSINKDKGVSLNITCIENNKGAHG